MDSVLLDIGIILIFTRIGSIISRKIKMPAVLGTLIAGVIIGPSVFSLVKESEGLRLLSELGVIMLMFLAGMETNVKELKKAGLSSFLIALGGIILPLLFGTMCASLFFTNFYENLFVGVILTATSVSISVETLTELGSLNTKAGINILGAAVIDDILGLVVISFVLAASSTSNMQDKTAMYLALGLVLLKVIVFCLICILMIKFLPELINQIKFKKGEYDTAVIFSIAAALLLGYLAEALGIAAITGAYAAGLMLSSVIHKDFIEGKVKAISHYFLTPIFFASVGLSTNIGAMNKNILLLTILMLITAVLGKIVGCGGTARLCGLNKRESIQVGMGMVSRGEVALITTNLGLQNGIITEKLFIPTLIVVIGTTLITPVLLKLAFSHRNTN
ncbi:MAG: cation:proton antiporter [Bacillota bacterium]|nr:cation:proton antiporter [Bacillota bacterium]